MKGGKPPVPPDFKIDIPASIVEWLRSQGGPAQPSLTLLDANRRLILTGRLVVDDDGRLVVDDDGSKTGMAKCRLKDVELGDA